MLRPQLVMKFAVAERLVTVEIEATWGQEGRSSRWSERTVSSSWSHEEKGTLFSRPRLIW